MSNQFLEPKNRVKQLRIQRGLTQEELARRVGCAPSSISEIENHRRKEPSYKVAGLLAKALGVSTWYVMGYGEELDE